MENEMKPYVVYVKIDEWSRTIAINSFTKPLESDSIQVLGHWEVVADILE